MKKTTYILGYFAAFATVISTVWKLNHLPYAGALIAGALILLSIYFPLFILDKMSDSGEGKTSPVHIVAALCAFIIILGIVFKLIDHLHLAGTLLTIGLVGFSLIFIPMLFIQKSKQAGANNLMNGAGAVGLVLFALGMLTKIQHWPGQIFLFIPGTALVFLIYFPMYMMSTAIPDEKKINHLRDTFFVVIIGCILLLFAWAMLGGKLLPPNGKLLPPSMTTDKTEQSK
jgi:hypothetical protein